jgi:hypothetical protein
VLSIPIIIIMVVLYVFFGDERAANRAAHEICPNTHVVRVDDHFQFGCDGHEYAVLCDRGECAVDPL